MLQDESQGFEFSNIGWPSGLVVQEKDAEGPVNFNPWLL